MKQVVLSGTALQSALLGGLRVLTVLIAGGTAILGFVGKRDLAGIVAYIQSSDGLAFAGAIVATGTFALSVYKTYRPKAQLIAVEPIVSDAIITTKEKSNAT